MKIKLLACVFYLISLSSCYAVRVDGPYEGRVIDADTRQPIEGVVVLGEWDTEMATPAGATHKFYDAKETVTDKNGEFKIKGLGLLVLSSAVPPNITVFKTGYSYDNLLWIPGELSLYSKMKWEGKKVIIPLKKLTVEERREMGGPPDPPSDAPFEKVQRMLKELDKDRIEQGLSPRGLWNGVRYE